MLNSPCHKMTQRRFQFFFFNEAIHGKHLEEDVAAGPCSPEQYFQLSSANSIQTIGELFAHHWGGLRSKSPTYLQDFM